MLLLVSIGFKIDCKTDCNFLLKIQLKFNMKTFHKKDVVLLNEKQIS
jgi:hypothetical protein